ncbi:MAG: AAA family ATPase [Candidatus Anstonellales archaeon]
MPSFSQLLERKSVFKNKDVLSPHYIPAILPFREKEIEGIMVAVSPSIEGKRAQNLFIYGKTGTGKTCSVKHVMGKLNEVNSYYAKMFYLNCRIYNSKYKVMHKITKTFVPELEKAGFGISLIYEKLLEWISQNKIQLIVVLDEIDMVKDLNELIYALTRANDELKQGGISIIGISNRLSFKELLDPRSRSSLCEIEMTFAPYDVRMMRTILEQRASIGLREGALDESALNLAAAVAANETGDARYALKLMLRAGEIADSEGADKVSDKHVEEARMKVEEDLVKETIITLPENQRLVLYAVANLSLRGGRYSRLGTIGVGESENEENFLLSGEVYEEYSKICTVLGKKRKSARWYREYLNELEMLGLITTVQSGRGIRGHTRLIKSGYPVEDMKRIVEEAFSKQSGASENTVRDSEKTTSMENGSL